MTPRVVVIGGGICGLATAHRLVRAGVAVTLLEASDQLGGLGTFFESRGRSVERFYHCVMPTDSALLALLDEVGVRESVGWRPTRMGMIVDGVHRPFNSALDLLRFRPLSLVNRVRFGVISVLLRRLGKGKDLDQLRTEDWLRGLYGDKVWSLLLAPMFGAKFGSAFGDVPALYLWERLGREMPAVKCSFEPADIVSDVMSFGSPTPVEVAVSGPNFDESKAYAEKVRAELEAIPTLRDVRYGQALDYPTMSVRIDRERAGLSGVTAEEIARSLVTATSSSRFVVPNYWPDPKSGIGYQVQVEIPYQIMNSVEDIKTIPVQHSGGPSLLLRDVADVHRETMPGEYDRYNMRRVVSMTANIEGEDLGRVASRIDKALKAAGEPPRGVTVAVRGQIVPMKQMFRGLSIGLVGAVVVILLLLTAYFQSFRLAFIAVTTVPAVLAAAS